MKNTEALRDYDAAEFLDNDELITSYLSDVLIDGNEMEIKIALSNVARAKSMTDLANKMGIKRDELFNLFFEEETLEFSRVQKFLNAIGVSLNAIPNMKFSAKP